MGNIYGYVRVSSIDQNEDRQLIVMDENNVIKVNIYIDAELGKVFVSAKPISSKECYYFILDKTN